MENKPMTLGYANGDLYVSESSNGSNLKLLQKAPINLNEK